MNKIFFVVVFCLTNMAFSQIKLQGVVKDSIGNPLELANVIAINQETKALESYAITDAKGFYKLALSKNSEYGLQVSYIGMKTFKEIIALKSDDLERDFTLQLDNVLDAVELTYEMPVTVKGDTLVYNADSFKNGSERKLEDIIEKLPGVEINEDGQIEVEGKVVNKLMVNGKELCNAYTELNDPIDQMERFQDQLKLERF